MRVDGAVTTRVEADGISTSISALREYPDVLSDELSPNPVKTPNTHQGGSNSQESNVRTQSATALQKRGKENSEQTRKERSYNSHQQDYRLVQANLFTFQRVTKFEYNW